MVQFCSVAQSCLTLCDPKDYSDPKSLGSRTAVCQASLSITNSQGLLKLTQTTSPWPPGVHPKKNPGAGTGTGTKRRTLGPRP